jgi:hypothetical protein
MAPPNVKLKPRVSPTVEQWAVLGSNHWPPLVESQIAQVWRRTAGPADFQAPMRHCAEICSHNRKQKARVCGPFAVGGTGIEPVTPSLSSGCSDGDDLSLSLLFLLK